MNHVLCCVSIPVVLLRQEALEAYGSCLGWVADNNLTTRRDVLEGMSRCCARLGRRDEALELADVLVTASCKTTHTHTQI